MKIILIYCTCSNKEEANSIADKLIEEKIVACSNCFPMTSKYFWDGQKQDDSELVLLLKTLDKNWELAKSHIEDLHSYDVPCIMKIEAEVNESYGNWIAESIN